MSQPPSSTYRPMVPVPYNSQIITTQLMISAVIFLFMVVLLIFFLYLYAKYCMVPHRSRRRRASFIFASADQIPDARRGLDTAVLNSLPIKTFKASEFKDGLECAVCLSELSEGEEARILPKCNHGFHVECIDMWFHSHSTCPLCRAPVVADDSKSLPESASSSSSNRSNVMLVIEIPRRDVQEIVSPLPTSRMQGEEMKSPPVEKKTPWSATLRSFRRLLSRGKMTVGPSCSPRGDGDIEQGEGCSLTPRTRGTN